MSGDWVHLLCAIWVPETGVANDVFMEPITGADKISKQRWKLVGTTHRSLPLFCLEFLEVLGLREEARRLCTVLEAIMFHRVSRNVC